MATLATTQTPPPPPPPGSSADLNIDVKKARQKFAPKSGNIGEGGYHAPDETMSTSDMDSLVKKNLADRLAGKNPSFSDEIMKLQKEKLFRETQGATRRARMSAMADAARRGVFASGATSSVIKGIEVEGMKAYTSGVKDLMIKKAQMDHEDMIQAINQAQQWIHQTRSYQLGKEQNAIAREGIKATLAAAAMQAAASRYAADQGLKGARAAAGAARYAADLGHERSLARTASGGYVTPNGSSPMTMQQAQFAGIDASLY